MISPEYVAGFFDGEGTVDLRYRRTHGGKYFRFEVRISFAQVDTAPLLAIQAVYGGSICRPKMSAASRLVVVGNDSRTLLAAMIPHLIVKRKEAELAVQFFALQDSNPPRYEKGRRGYLRTDQAVTDEKIVLFEAIRKVMQDKGFCITRRKKQDFQ